MSRTIQVLLVLLLSGIVREDASSAKNVSDGPHSCGGVDIPYPFGIGDGNFRKGFKVVCEDGKPGFLTRDIREPIPLSDFSVEMAEVRAWLPVVWQCYDDSSKVNDSYSLHIEISKKGVHRISNTRNNLFVLGCNTLGYLGSKPETDGNNSYYAQYTSCLSYCDNPQSAESGACSGVGCCHADIPPDLIDNDLSFDNSESYNHSYMLDFSPCDYAFVAEKDYTFNTTDLKRDLSRTPWLMPVRLDWAIRDNNFTCKEANKKQGYACRSSNSLCHNSTNGPGYICKCCAGYEGNPYIANGCTDINECEHLGPHYHCKGDCKHLGSHYHCKGDCKNKQGYYECTCPKYTRSADPHKEERNPDFPTEAKIIVGVIGGLFVVAFMVGAWYLIKEKRKMREHFVKNGGPTLQNLDNIKLFKKEDIRKIQKSSNIIGRGGFGKVYKGYIGDSNQLVAVKEPIIVNSANRDQFANEIIIQSRVIHKNIVKLIGCCLQVDVPILVYEYLPKGSLHDILHGGSNMSLDMGLRLQIAAESAEGLAYMHSKTTTAILHGDVKPANILLDDEFIPKISDFGISRLIATGKQHTGHVIGDMRYMDPIFMQTGLLTKKSDVYSFGVVLLELITRKKASFSDNNNNLLKNFLEAYTNENSVIELVDKELAEVDREIIDNFAGLIMRCINLDVNQRPEMIEVAELLRALVKMYLTKEDDLPNDHACGFLLSS